MNRSNLVNDIISFCILRTTKGQSAWCAINLQFNLLARARVVQRILWTCEKLNQQQLHILSDADSSFPNENKHCPYTQPQRAVLKVCIGSSHTMCEYIYNYICIIQNFGETTVGHSCIKRAKAHDLCVGQLQSYGVRDAWHYHEPDASQGRWVRSPFELGLFGETPTRSDNLDAMNRKFEAFGTPRGGHDS